MQNGIWPIYPNQLLHMTLFNNNIKSFTF